MLHPNLSDHWFEWETAEDGKEPRLIAVLVTDIPATGPGFDSSAMDDMIDAVRAEYSGNPSFHISGYRIRSATRND